MKGGGVQTIRGRGEISKAFGDNTDNKRKDPDRSENKGESI